MPTSLATVPRPARLALWALAIAAIALLLRLVLGAGSVNYDSLYALIWGRDLGHGHLPDYRVVLAPTPHPLAILVGLVLSPLSSHASGPVYGKGATEVAVGGAFVVLALLGWLVYRLGKEWFNAPTGLVAGLVILTREVILQDGATVYVDIPYLVLVLAAVLVETRRSRAGWPVLALLALAGLIRPEAWAFGGLYWLWLLAPSVDHPLARRIAGDAPARSHQELAWLFALVVSAPVLWAASDLAVTGNPVFSLTSTRHTASTLGRVTGLLHTPEYIPRRIGETLRPPVLLGAAIGGVMTLWCVPRRAATGATVGIAAVVVFAALATAGLPINTRYAFLADSILCIFCGAAVFGFLMLPGGDPRRRLWMIGAAVTVLALLAYIPSERTSIRSLRSVLRTQHVADGGLRQLIADGTVGHACGPVAVPNERVVPVLALALNRSPKQIVDAHFQGAAGRGTYLQPTGKIVGNYILDKQDPERTLPAIPAGFRLAARQGPWLVYRHCR
jgi:hypothetical protein